METQEPLSSKVLSQILLIESMVSHLPDETTIFSFVCRGLETIPGGENVTHTSNQALNSIDIQTETIFLTIDNRQYGAFNFLISDSTVFSLYRPYLNNLCHMLTVLLDQRRQRNEILKANNELEIRVEQRTQELKKEVHERQIAEKMAISQRIRAERYLEVSQAIIIELDKDGAIVNINSHGCDILGYSESQIIGQDWFALALPKAVQSEVRDVFTKNISGDAAFIDYFENKIITRNGDVRFVTWNNVPKWDEHGNCEGTLSSGQDITERKANEDKVEYLAFHDPLTDLPNRRLLLDRLERSLFSQVRKSRSGALLLLDMDDFKTLNDTLGHDVGDQLLVEVGRRLQDAVREGDTVARLGGDEFVLILEDLSIDDQAAMQAEVIATKILQLINHPYLLDLSDTKEIENTRSYHCSSSIGIALFKGNSLSSDELMKRADTAMYKAKEAGRNRICFFDPEMQSIVSARSTLERDLREAVHEGQFSLYYQPQVDSAGCLKGAEALIRWHHPTRGMVSPDEFIPQSESMGLIYPIGQWVLETACNQLVAWEELPTLSHLTLSVNVSARQFNCEHFYPDVMETINRTGVNPKKLKLELTESLFLDDVDDTIAIMEALQLIGISFSLDDFGTGYSSLSYLRRLPLEQLKIDRSFVKDVLTDDNATVIARTIVALTESMGLMVIAEGVETEEQREFLATNGCTNYQGYLFSRPLPIDIFCKVWNS